MWVYRRPLGRPGFGLVVYISVVAVMAAGGFALTASPFCQTPQKEPKGLAPSVRPLAKARRSFATVSIRGHCPPVGFASTYMQRVRLRRTALRATPRMNTSTQPSEGAGRSKAAGELTLGLMSGEEQVGVRRFAFLWELACRGAASQRWRPDSRPITHRCTPSLHNQTRTTFNFAAVSPPSRSRECTRSAVAGTQTRWLMRHLRRSIRYRPCPVSRLGNRS